MAKARWDWLGATINLTCVSPYMPEGIRLVERQTAMEQGMQWLEWGHMFWSADLSVLRSHVDFLGRAFTKIVAGCSQTDDAGGMWIKVTQHWISWLAAQGRASVSAFFYGVWVSQTRPVWFIICCKLTSTLWYHLKVWSGQELSVLIINTKQMTFLGSKSH